MHLGLLALGGLLLGARPAAAQGTDLLKELDRNQAAPDLPNMPKAEYAQATFKSVRLINGHSCETATKGTMHFLIGHRFGRLNEGAYEFFGLDAATIRLGLEYGVTRDLTVGIGRSSLEKTYDGFVKYRAIRQGSGPGTLPFTLTALATSAISTIKYTGQPLEDRSFKTRLTYTYQVMLARKFNESFSLQLMPTLVHRNLVTMKKDDNECWRSAPASATSSPSAWRSRANTTSCSPVSLPPRRRPSTRPRWASTSKPVATSSSCTSRTQTG